MPRSVNGTGSGGSGGGGPHDDADHEETFATDADVSASITAAVATVVGGGNRPFGLLIQLTDQKVCYHTHLLRSSELVLEMLVPSKDLKKIRHLAS